MQWISYDKMNTMVFKMCKESFIFLQFSSFSVIVLLCHCEFCIIFNVCLCALYICLIVFLCYIVFILHNVDSCYLFVWCVWAFDFAFCLWLRFEFSSEFEIFVISHFHTYWIPIKIFYWYFKSLKIDQDFVLKVILIRMS